MSDDDERQTSSNINSTNHRLIAIKSKLQELTREKTKYDIEKLTHDIEFLHVEIGLLSHTIADINKEINAQTVIKRTLNAQMAILRSNSGLRYTNLEIALRDKERYEKELAKQNKTPIYRDLAQQKINSINEALPQLRKQDEYYQKLQTAEDKQISARNKREKLVESLNTKTRKQTELKVLLVDSAIKLPNVNEEIKNLRFERDKIVTAINAKKQRRHIPPTLGKPAESPIQSFALLEQDTLDFEKQQHNEQLEKIRLLLKYFQEKMSEHNLSINITPCSTPSAEVISPLFYPITPFEEQTILSSYMNEQDYENDSLIKTTTTTTSEPTIAIAMKLPRHFAPLDIHSTTTNEIIRSSYHRDNSVQYKKELPNDIVDKYAGIGKKKEQQQQQQLSHGKKNKRNKKNSGLKHPSQMVVLYNDVRKSTGNSDTLPYMPLFEYELLPTVKALQLMEQSVESYLNELSQRDQDHLSAAIDDEHSEIVDEDDIRDSALDTFSETSSLIEPTNFPKELISVIPILQNIPEARSSSSSDDKKTVVSSTSPPSSHHSHAKTENQSSSSVALTIVEELPSFLLPLTIQIAQIERQISDEGYRSVRNGKQQQLTGMNNNNNQLPLLTRSASYDCTEKVDKWLSSTTPPLSMSIADGNTDFQATDFDNEDENLLKAPIPVPDDLE